jgi:two-component system cell cycle sensor histidine kinase/response regulator CckA
MNILKRFIKREFKIHEDALLLWRKRIFFTIFLSAILIASLSYIPNVKISFQSGKWLNVFVYTITYLIGIIITFVEVIPFKLRAWSGLFLFYSVGLISMLTIGPVGSGRIVLFTFAILTCLLLGLKAAVIALILNVCTFFLVAWLLYGGYFEFPHLTDYTAAHWIANGLTFLFMSIVITVSLGVFVAVLEKNLKKEQSLTKELRLSNEQLERENKERRMAEESLRKSRERYRTLTNNLHVGIYRNTVGPEGKFLEANPAILKMFGLQNRDELFKINVSDLYQNPDERKSFEGKIRQKGFIRNEELKLKRKDGNHIICSVSAVAIKDEKGEVHYYDGVVEDITERKQLEAQIQQAQKMKAIGTLAGGVAHDLNNILSGIVSYPELILMDLPDESPLIEPIKTIEESGKRAAAIVQDLLTLARRGVSVSEVVNLNDIINEYLLSPQFEKLKSYHPNVEIESDLNSALLNTLGSPVHLSKTVMNIVSNAAEALPNGGKIQIKTNNQYVDSPITGYDDVKEGDYTVLTVSDNGIGIDPEEINRIFEPFYTKKIMGRSGTGLGMAVVWGTVKDHSGYIHVESDKGKGTTIELYFPVTRKSIKKDEISISWKHYKGDGQTILIVDDIREQREVAAKILTHLGYSTETVSSGEEACEFLESKSADLIVLDMIMQPGIDGLETYKRIISKCPQQKAIIASGFSETERVKEAQRLGAGRYVKKPYTIEKMGMAVKSELNKSQIAA